jgi:opacity protein-like surface antigen
MKKLALLSVTALLLTSGMAGAADVPVKAIPPAPKAVPCCEGWEGFYFGVYFGSGQGRTSATSTDSSTNQSTFTRTIGGVLVETSTSTSITNGASSLSGNTTGSVVNLFGGYNWQLSPTWVVGAQLEGTVFSDITSKAIGPRSAISTRTTTDTFLGVTTTSTTNSTSFNTDQLLDELRSTFSFIGRAGFLATPNFLIYALGGGTLGNFVVPDDFDPFGGQRSKWKLGYTVGAGGEWKMNKNWFLRAEYRFMAFKVDRDQSSSSSTSSTFVSPGPPIEIEQSTFQSTSARSSSNNINIHLGTIGVAYRFCYCDY